MKAGGTGSSLVYSPSQLDAAGDVDPVAEADVYLAYGRDLQAEEILKEAMRTTPQRVAIHSKLLEIYAKRRDAKAFELVATEAYGLTRGEGPEWEHICELGQELDAVQFAVPARRPAGRAPRPRRRKRQPRPASFGATHADPGHCRPSHAGRRLDLDLDLDFSLGDDEPAAPAPQPCGDPAHRDPRCRAAHARPGHGLRLGHGRRCNRPQPPRDARSTSNSLSFDCRAAWRRCRRRRTAPVAAAAPAAEAGMIEFDLGALSLDLPGQPPAAARSQRTRPDEAQVSTQGADPASPPASTTAAAATRWPPSWRWPKSSTPSATRTAHAAWPQEVLAEASGDLKHRAQRFLAEIS